MPAGGPRPGRGDQRSRLLDAIVAVVGRDGYLQAKIGEIAERAGVSRATFYELFEDKEECFLAAHRERSERISAEMGQAVAKCEPSDAARAAVVMLVEFADREPHAFSFLAHEAMLAGARGAEERDRLIALLAQQIELALSRSPDEAPTPDMPVRILLGGIIRVLGVHMRRGEDRPRELLADLLVWIDSYTVPRGAQIWRRITPGPAFLHDDSREIAAAPLAPEALPRGRRAPRLPGAMVKRVQQERILYATAGVITAKGYANTTVADIVAAAGVSREVFYAHFHDKQEAFDDTFERFFEQIMAASASAFFGSAGTWEDRVWEAGRAITRFVVSAPSLCHFGFVECYAPGPASARRTDDLILGFTMFTEAGYRVRPEAAQVPRLVSEALTGVGMEEIAFHIRHDRVAEVPALLPLAVYIILTPFVGVHAACDFVDRKLREAS